MQNKVVLITGGTSGIGKALAEVFAKNGAKVAITGRKKETLDQTTAQFRQQGLDILAIQADGTIEADNQKMIDEVIKHYQKLDILINNAGISMRAMFEDLDLKIIKDVMNINFFGAVYATKFALPHILETKGSIVGISSVAGFRGVPARAGYSASKFALQGFLEVLRTELRPKNVHVMIVSPGFIATNIRENSLLADGTQQGQSPRNEKKMMSAEKCAEIIYNGIRKRKKILIITFMGKLVVFLNKLFPLFMDKMVYREMAKEQDAPFK